MVKLPQFVTQEGLDNLKHYKYSGLDKSLLVKYILAPYFWNPLVEKLPKWLAPNLITLIGGLFMVFALWAVQYYMLPGDTPYLSVNLFCAVMIFLYQTADNLDGKQARRTKSSSPLGELFDHGVDSLTMGIFSIIVALNLQLTSFEIVALFLTLNIVFYLTHWEEYYVGILVLGYVINPTELQYGSIIFLLFQALFPHIGNYPIKTLLINEIIFFVMIGCVILACLKYIWGVFWWCKKNNHPFMKAFLNLTGFALFTFFSFCVAFCCDWDMLDDKVVFWALVYSFILINGYLTQRLVVHRICKEEIVVNDTILIVYGAFSCLISYFAVLEKIKYVRFLSIVLGIVAFAFEALLVYDVCTAFCKHLGIKIFKINPPVEHDEEEN